MAGELLGLQFGTYSGVLNELKQKYDVRFKSNSQQKDNRSEFTLYEKNTNRSKGNGYKGGICFDEYNQPKYTDAVIFKDGYQYGTSAKDEKNLDVFDYIVGKDEYAIDLNGDNKVEKGEIFNGQFDVYAYRKAKASGDLKNYTQYLKAFK